jgi:membrane-bound serine protease (ClpP class)
MRCVGPLLLLLGLSLSAPADDAALPEKPAYQRPVLIRVEGEIDSWLEHYVLRKLEIAKSQNCDLLILEIDSPGGGLWETENLCDKFVELQGVHTVAFVPREALSGAAILSLACDEIILADHARIGDCGPIYLAEDFLFRHAEEKVRSDLIARVRSLAERKKHPPALAEAMVDRNVKVERVRLPEGNEQLLTDREIAAKPEAAQWEKLEVLPEAGGNRFFECLGKRAKELGLASANVERRDELAAHLALAAPPQVLESNVVDHTAYWLNSWLVTALLLIVGLVALAYELSAPGVGIGALTAGLCFALFFWARFLGGTSGWLEVLLFGAGVIFLAVEIFLIPGFGVTGISGILLMLTGIVLASQEFVLPTTGPQLVTSVTSLGTVLGSALVGLVICALAMRHMQSIPVLNRLMLQPPAPVAAEALSPDKVGLPEASFVQLGDVGEATTLLRPGGKARFGDVLVDVVADGAFIQAGRAVRVVQLVGSRVVVEAVASLARA